MPYISEWRNYAAWLLLMFPAYMSFGDEYIDGRTRKYVYICMYEYMYVTCKYSLSNPQFRLWSALICPTLSTDQPPISVHTHPKGRYMALKI